MERSANTAPETQIDVSNAEELSPSAIAKERVPGKNYEGGSLVA